MVNSIILHIIKMQALKQNSAISLSNTSSFIGAPWHVPNKSQNPKTISTLAGENVLSLSSNVLFLLQDEDQNCTLSRCW